MPGKYRIKHVNAPDAWSFQSVAWKRPSAGRAGGGMNGKSVSTSVRRAAPMLAPQASRSPRQVLGLMAARAHRKRPTAGPTGPTLRATAIPAPMMQPKLGRPQAALQREHAAARPPGLGAPTTGAVALARRRMAGLSSVRLAGRAVRSTEATDAVRRRSTNAPDDTDAAVPRAARARIAAQMQAQRVSLLAG